ncbi:hypothetical protein M2092_000663 [Fusobacterium sp. PH5-44]
MPTIHDNEIHSYKMLLLEKTFIIKSIYKSEKLR